MTDKLTAQQAQAVENRGGALLVSAAAGSGKTKVLVDRLMCYLTDPNDPANLDEFVIITYTKAAASELRGKIAAKLSERIALEPENRHLQKQMQRLFLTKISTVHGFCSDLVREYAYRLDVAADFRVADEEECRELRDNVLADLIEHAYETAGENPDFLTFVDALGYGRDDRSIPEIIEKVYDSARCHLDPYQWLKACLKASETEGIADAGQTLWGQFLLDDLREYLECQISAMRFCAHAADLYPELGKVSANLWNTVDQLQALAQAETWNEVVACGSIRYGILSFPKNNPDLELTAQIKAVRDACKTGLKKKLENFSDNSEQVLQDLSQSSPSHRCLMALVDQFDHDYSSVKRSRRMLDFSDLEHKTLDLLLGKSRTNPSAAAAEIGQRYREIMVDEYQDSNAVQDAIFSVLTRARCNCFLVGDVKQSIYQFRLADPSIFLDKYHTYLPVEKAGPGDGRKVLLSHNFRSGPEIVEAVNSVFRTCMRPKVGGLHYGEAEELREGIPHSPLSEPGVELHALETDDTSNTEEAFFVAERIRSMLDSGTLVRCGDDMRPVKPEDFVILLRSPGTTARYYQQALEGQGIRCSTGGDTDLLHSEEIETLWAFLQTIRNPRQDIPLITTLASPIFGFTADDLAAFRSQQRWGSVYDALLNSDTAKVRHFLSVLKELRTEAQMNTLTSLLERCFTLTRLDSIYAAMPNGEAKAVNLQTFFQMAADFENGTLRDLSQFLDHLDSLSQHGRIPVSSASSGCVTIMSIHKSKGLEFPVVFLCGLARKFNKRSLTQKIYCDKDLMLGLPVADAVRRIQYPSIAKRAIAVKMNADGVSEEMRLLYVAMTRARDRLIMTYAAKNLSRQVQDIALRQNADGGELLCRSASCLGSWILQSALHRTEAGALHLFGDRPTHTYASHYPWKIQVAQTTAHPLHSTLTSEERPPIPSESIELLRCARGFQYPHTAATLAPSKQTATSQKGRVKDAEAAENTSEPTYPTRTWRQPSFCKGSVTGKEYGNAMHAALQYMRYACCGSVGDVRSEVDRLVSEGFLTDDQRAMVNCEQIAAFFQTVIGKKLRSGTPYLREFKFSIMDNGCRYGGDLEGEQILLQGVIDCALLEDDGITIIDFKTDSITQETMGKAIARYQSQVAIYADALSRIYEMPVKAQYLYFFRMNQLVEL